MTKKHGLEGTRFCNIYRNVRDRCQNQNNIGYKFYGGRGIKNMWLNLSSFKDDMYLSYLSHVEEHGEKKTTIERINVNGDYSKQNCRWATPKEQGSNKRNNRLLTLNGETLTMSAWARKVGLDVRRLHKRLKEGWSLEKALLPIMGSSERGRLAANARWNS